MHLLRLTIFCQYSPRNTRLIYLDHIYRWNLIPDPNSSPPKNEVGLTTLFAEIRQTVDTEAQIVKAVFPNPPVVMQVFLQRIFAQSVCTSVRYVLLRLSDYRRVDTAAHGTASSQRS